MVVVVAVVVSTHVTFIIILFFIYVLLVILQLTWLKYQREGQPRKTENELTSDRWRRFLKNLNLNLTLTRSPMGSWLNPKIRNQGKKLRKRKIEPSGFELQNSQNPPFHVRQPNQLCQMAIRCKLHNFLVFYRTTLDWQEVSSQSYAAVLPVGTI